MAEIPGNSLLLHRLAYGGGDEYAYEFWKWWQTLTSAAQQDYQARYPEPPGWRGWYTDEDLDEDEDGEAAGPADEPWPDAD